MKHPQSIHTDMPVKIRKALPSHLPACTAALMHSEIGRAYFPSEKGVVIFLEEGIAKGEVYVALDQSGTCLGYCWFSLTGSFYRYPYLRNISVLKEARKQGVGTALLKYYERRGFAHANRIFLLVSHFNIVAQKLYHDLGYVQVGSIPDMIRPGITELIMMKLRKEKK